MKKISFLLMCLFSSMMMQAGEITEAQALQKAQQILKGRQLVKERARTRGAVQGPGVPVSAQNWFHC